MSELFSQYSQPVLPPGTKLKNGFYTILEETVNEGGFGRIYRAKANTPYRDDPWKKVALKEFCINQSQFEPYKNTFIGEYTRRYLSDRVEEMRERFLKEPRLLEHLNKQRDRHVPMIEKGIFYDLGRIFYAMTYIDGPTLTDVVKGRYPMSEEQAVDYIVQIGKHFGNARSYNKFWESITKKQDQDLLSIEDDKAEQEGTPGFCPSAQYIGTKQGDIYSLAATLYYLLTAETLLKKLSSQRSKDNAISKLKSHNVSDKTVNAIMHALDLESADSTKDAKTFLWQLPYDIVFNSLLNYNDYDYNKR